MSRAQVFPQKRSEGRIYLQIVEGARDGGMARKRAHQSGRNTGRTGLWSLSISERILAHYRVGLAVVDDHLFQ